MMPFISVIVPVYNAEQYVADTIESILAQTYGDFELLMVNDCSTDRSLEIIREYEKKDSRVKVLDLEVNHRVARARNRALDIVQGEYVYFADADDVIVPELFEELHNSVLNHPCDVVMFGLTESYYDNNGNVINQNTILPGSDECFDDPKDVHSHIIDYEKLTLYGYVWNKLFRRSIIDEYNVRNINTNIYSDLFFCADFFDHVSSMNVINKSFYQYKKQNATSITAKFVPDYYDLSRKRIQILTDQMKAWNTFDDHAKTILANYYSRYVFSSLQRNLNPKSGMTDSDNKAFLEKVFSDELWIELRDYIPAGASASGILNFMAKHSMKEMCLMSAKFIDLVKNKNQKLFNKLK